MDPDSGVVDMVTITHEDVRSITREGLNVTLLMLTRQLLLKTWPTGMIEGTVIRQVGVVRNGLLLEFKSGARLFQLKVGILKGEWRAWLKPLRGEVR